AIRGLRASSLFRLDELFPHDVFKIFERSLQYLSSFLRLDIALDVFDETLLAFAGIAQVGGDPDESRELFLVFFCLHAFLSSEFVLQVDDGPLGTRWDRAIDAADQMDRQVAFIEVFPN